MHVTSVMRMCMLRKNVLKRLHNKCADIIGIFIHPFIHQRKRTKLLLVELNFV